MSWVYLVAAILFEVAGTTCMKLSHGFEKLTPSILLFVFYVISFTLLSMTLKKMDVSVAYAIWSGLGTALIAVIGVVWFGEDLTWQKTGWIALIIAGVMGLNLSGGVH